MIVGIDVGTSGLKAVVVGDDLAVRGQGRRAYGVAYPRPGWAEQDPRLWEAALAPAIADALAEAGVGAATVRGIGVVGQLDGCVAVGADGAALAPCLIWMDRRAETEIAAIPAKTVRERAGVVLDATHMAAKIAWLRVALGGNAACYHQPVSYLVSRLTGVDVFDHGLASTTMLYAPRERDFDPALLDLFAIERRLLPAIADADAVAGPLTTAGAALTGLAAGIPVAVGTGDDFANPLGAGLTAPGRVVCCLGTAEVVGALHPEPLVDARALVETHGYPGGLYFIENPGWLAGGAIDWFVATFGLVDAAALDRLAAATPPGADGVIFLPALSGAMAPEWVAGARGCFYGLSPAHGAGHMARAVLEGCAFAMRDVIERLAEMGVAHERVLLVGGGSESPLWAHIRADVSGLPVEIAARADTAPIAAAMLAAVAAGVVPTWRPPPLASPVPGR